MQVVVKLFASFREGRFKVEARQVFPGSTVAMVLADLGLPEEEIGVLLVNGRHAEPDQQLNDGDTCAVFPQIGGG
ncbi:MAG: MoaD/ThiS family protein [Deltaproteobacteria bacterium]|nr:MoaD/ThiS family protein [Candidatus Anaeroferrophillus wilburensis]MBN2889412.1 MoaD/ThiS family protein [Deltaproteobacteria bacterium]